MGIKQVIWYFFPYRKPIARFPRRIAQDREDIRTASADELALIEFGVARTPKEARRIIADSGGKHALDIIDAMPKRGGVFTRRLQCVVMAIEGASYSNPNRRSKGGGMRYKVRYE